MRSTPRLKKFRPPRSDASMDIKIKQKKLRLNLQRARVLRVLLVETRVPNVQNAVVMITKILKPSLRQVK